MSNNKHSMKLYTEEQLERAIDLAKRNVSKNRIVESLTPIELPSKEEIEKMAIERFPISMEVFGSEKIDGNKYFRSIFIQGIECFRELIQGGNK